MLSAEVVFFFLQLEKDGNLFAFVTANVIYIFLPETAQGAFTTSQGIRAADENHRVASPTRIGQKASDY
jgi:hypothetical protein